MECPKDTDPSKPEPEPSTAAAEDTSGRPAAHCSADCLRGPGAATAAVPVAGTDLSSFHHASTSDTASALTAAATAERWFITAPRPSGFTASTSSETRSTIQIFWEE